MGIEGYFSLFIVITTVVALFIEILPQGIILFLSLGVFLLFGIISPEEAFSGLSNEGMIIIALLFIVSAGVQATGAQNPLIYYFLKLTRKSGPRRSMIKMMAPLSVLSAFFNNTPIVMIFGPIVKKWAERLNFSPSKFLIPLSYAAMLGGMCTLIGTSSNLVVHGLMVEKGYQGIGLFELAKVGVPCLIVGVIYLTFIGYRLLPDRKDILESVSENRKEYVIEMKVTSGCELINKTITEAGLRNLKNLFLIEIEREGKALGPAEPDMVIKEDDRLIFVGVTSAIVELNEFVGLVPAAHEMFERDYSQIYASFIEAVVSPSSPMLGKTVKEARFRDRYDAGVMAVHRNGERVKEKIGSIRLRAGDTLLLLGTHDFEKNWTTSSDFYLVSKLKEAKPQSNKKAPLAVGIMCLMILAVVFSRYLPLVGGRKIGMLYASFIAAALMLVTGCLSADDAKKAIKPNVLLTIICAFGIGKALYNTGASSYIASLLVNLFSNFGPVGALSAIYLMTVIFASVITHIAAAAIIFPIALSAASMLNVDPRPFFIALTLGASASFATPIGYQTNIIVQGIVGYKFKDYLKVGLPLNLILFVVTIILVPLFWKF